MEEEIYIIYDMIMDIFVSACRKKERAEEKCRQLNKEYDRNQWNGFEIIPIILED